jgi:hypothetical protein
VSPINEQVFFLLLELAVQPLLNRVVAIIVVVISMTLFKLPYQVVFVVIWVFWFLELVFVFIPRIVEAFFIIVASKLIETVLVKEITIWIVESLVVWENIKTHFVIKSSLNFLDLSRNFGGMINSF